MATTYIHFTEEQKDQARRTDLRSFLLGQGEKVERSGSEYKWNHGGEKITIRGNLWFNQYEPDSGGGDAIAFAREFYGLDFPGGGEVSPGTARRCHPPAEGCTGEGEKVLCPSSEE